jgi:hypothetical protein
VIIAFHSKQMDINPRLTYYISQSPNLLF